MLINSTLGFAQSTLKKEAVDKHRIKKVAKYHDNGALSIKGKEKRYYEHLGCLGKMPVYKKKGRWKYYDENGDLIKVVTFKKNIEVKKTIK